MARQYGVKVESGYVSECTGQHQAKELVKALVRDQSRVSPRVVFRDSGSEEWREDVSDD